MGKRLAELPMLHYLLQLRLLNLYSVTLAVLF